jgi:hypothetical protein
MYDHGHASLSICPCRVSIDARKVMVEMARGSIEIPIEDISDFKFIKNGEGNQECQPSKK